MKHILSNKYFNVSHFSCPLIYTNIKYTYHMIKALEEKNEGVFDYRGGNEEPVMFK